MVRSLVCGILVGAAAAAWAAEERFVRSVELPNGRVAVIAEGDLEARSIGTYAVRLYERAATGDVTGFASGVIARRDGTIEDVRVADLNGKGDLQLVVVVRSAGSGGYLSAQAFSFTDKKIEARSHVEDLPKDADPIAALTKTTKSDSLLGKGKYHDPNAGARP